MGKYFNVGLRLTAQEFDQFLVDFKRTTCRSKSAYLRKKIFGGPLTVVTRNGSLDDFVEVAVKVRRDLLDILALPGLGEVERVRLEKGVTHLISELQKTAGVCMQG